MKKLFILILISISTLLLTSCSQNPFNAPVGTEFVQSDTIAFNYFNGINSNELFEYTFSKEYSFFVGPVGANYSFTSINNYMEISNEFKEFLEFYNGYITYDRFENDSVDDQIKLSLGASDSDYNTTKVDIDGDVFDVDAYIPVENGLRVVFSYTEFYSDGEKIIVPFNLSVIVYDIHEAYLKEYLGIDNDYVDERAILTKYTTSIVPFPSKVGFHPADFGDHEDELTDLGHYMRLIGNDEVVDPHIEDVCTESIVEDCFEPEFSVISGFIFNMSIGNVIEFYEESYGGTYINEDFIITNRGVSFKVVLASGVLEVDYSDQAGTSENVVTFEVSIYNN